jgi:hypothetical protein
MNYREYNRQTISDRDTYPDIPTQRHHTVEAVELGRRWSGYPYYVLGHAGGIGLVLIVVGMFQIFPFLIILGAILWGMSFSDMLWITYRRRKIDQASNVQQYVPRR